MIVAIIELIAMTFVLFNELRKEEITRTVFILLYVWGMINLIFYRIGACL